MPRRPRRLSPEDGPLAAFALQLRALRDSGGPTAPTPEEISAKEGIHRTTIYAALAGKRVPSRDVLAAIVQYWKGDQAEWTSKRSKLENALATTRELQHQQAREIDEPARHGDHVTWGDLERAGLNWAELSDVDRVRPRVSDSARTEFAADLKKLIRQSGYTYREISWRAARMPGRGLAPSTISDAVRGDRRQRLETVIGIVAVATNGDHREVQKWRHRWQELQSH